MEILKLLIENNPGLFTALITSFFLPLGILWMTNSNNKKTKEIEKKLEVEYNSKEDIRKHEKIVYASLTRILFEVQQLYVSLSGSCIDENCITEAIRKFDSSQSKHHEEISNNMLYLSSNVINKVYSFYNEISRLKVELKELNDKKKFDLALVAVHTSSGSLAEIVIDIQEVFVAQRADLKIEFKRTQQEMMKYCCGERPPQELIERYEKLKNTVILPVDLSKN